MASLDAITSPRPPRVTPGGRDALWHRGLRRAALAFVASLGAHATAVAILDVPAAEPGPTGWDPVVARFEARSAAVEGASRQASPHDVAPGGGRVIDNLSAPVGRNAGEGGAVTFTLLVSRPDRVRLQDGLPNARAEAQVQRIRTSRERASWEDRRATPNPETDPFLASGSGRLRERRALAVRESAAGAARAAIAERPAGPSDLGRQRPSSTRTSPGAGIAGGRGMREMRRSNVAFGRPDLDRGPAATLAESPGPVQDNQDSERLASQIVGSWVEASPRSGLEPGPGRGGARGAGPASRGVAEGAGALGRPTSPGPGRFGALDTGAYRYSPWFVRQRDRVHQRVRFPRDRARRRDQGVAIVSARIGRDGRLRAARTARSSGFEDFDRAALAAVRSAAPFEPLPDHVLAGQDPVVIRIPVDFRNPMFGH